MRQDPQRVVWRAALGPAVAVALVLGSLVAACTGVPCVRTGVAYGLWVERCPATQLRLGAALEVEGTRGGDEVTVAVDARATWLSGSHRGARSESAPLPGATTTVRLLDADGAEVDGLEVADVRYDAGSHHAQLRLPSLPDGDYRLQARVDAGFEAVELEADVPVYAPAVVQLLTDRPLYQGGDEVRVRAVVLRRDDLRPAADRPGRWLLLDPSGQRVVEERATTDAWGVVSATLPLDPRAANGTWTVAYGSGGAAADVPVEVRPFQLPRFEVSLRPTASWFAVGERLTVDGWVRYASGAPVAGATYRARVRTPSAWPVPDEWGSAHDGRTDEAGHFRVVLDPVPADLRGRVLAELIVGVTDPAGERIDAAVQVPLSADPLWVELASELQVDGQPGLAAEANNRLYLRVATPDGAPLANTPVRVVDAAAPHLDGVVATTDADGVAAVQLDPGRPVTLIEPPAPQRDWADPGRRRRLLVSAGDTAAGVDAADRRAIEAWAGVLEACGAWSPRGGMVRLRMQVDAAGALSRALAHDGGAAGACAAAAIAEERLPPGRVRTLELRWWGPLSRTPYLTPHGAPQGALGETLTALVDAVSACAEGTGAPPADGGEALRLHWGTRRGQRGLEIVTEPLGARVNQACVARAVDWVQLPEAAQDDALGSVLARWTLPEPDASPPQPTTRPGFQLLVEAGEAASQGRVVVTAPVAPLPPLRIRLTPAVVTAGAPVKVQLLRGPDFSSVLPERVRLVQPGGRVLTEARVDPTRREATLEVPDDARGFAWVEHRGAVAVLHIRPPLPLAIELSTTPRELTPGEPFTVNLRTTARGKATSAAVTVVGVDRRLGQLVPLQGPEAWSSLHGGVEGGAAWGGPALVALQGGLVRGENAAMALLTEVRPGRYARATPAPWRRRAEAAPDAGSAEVQAFYRGLVAVRQRVRDWEAGAPAGARFTEADAAAHWRDVLSSAAAEGAPITDAYGRPLRLALLPDELLAEVAPARLVGDRTRLEEDRLDWLRWVRENLR